MQHFPAFIIQSMQRSGASTTCVPIEYLEGGYESTVFFELGGAECDVDRTILAREDRLVGINLEAELIEHGSAGVVMLRFEVMTQPGNPLAGEVLIVPGLGNVQFETLKLLSQQQNLKFYFSDEHYRVIHAQQLVMSDNERRGYADILQQVTHHDALIRLTGKYNAKAALSEIVNHYDVCVD